MENFRFTLFNGITLFVMALAAVRIKGRPTSNWPLLYYVVVLGYAIGLHYSLNVYIVLAGFACALLQRFKLYGRAPRIAELAVLAYVTARCVALVMMW